MSATKFHASILELIRRTSAFLPPDVTNVLEVHRAVEQQGSKADLALELVMQNIGMAKKFSAPICQDTGSISFYIKRPSTSTSSDSAARPIRLTTPANVA